MEIKYGLISSDDHLQLNQDNWTKRMSEKKWGSKIPQLRPTQDPAHMATDWGEADTWRWFIYDKPESPRGVANCPTMMQDPKWGEAGAHRKYFPQRWSDVPLAVYDPVERTKAMDKDGIDAAVLFPNDPVQSTAFFQGDAEFELDCVRAYNDGAIEWVQTSPRLMCLPIIPYLNGIEATCAEVTRVSRAGLNTGIVMLAEPSGNHKDLKHFNDPYWDPLWALCQDLEMPIHWHAGGGIGVGFRSLGWSGYTRNEMQALGPTAGFSIQAQFLPNVIFSGVLDRYPSLKWVCAETGLGWVNYILEGCDHEWERRHLWTEGITSKPSDLFHRQMYVDFWYEQAGIQLRHEIGMDNIMWEADFPHSTATYPESWEFVNRTLEGVPQKEREQLQYGNAVKLYKLG